MSGDAIGIVPAKPNAAAIRSFFGHYAEALELCHEARLALFVLPHRLTFASRSIEALAERAAHWSSKGYDVYGHIHLHRLPEGANRHRGSVATARVAVGVYEDIDAQGPGRKKPAGKLCPTVADAISVVEAFNKLYQPLRVSLLIGSGYGCYPAILLKEPVLLHTDQQRILLESTARRFHGALLRIAAQRGWSAAVDFADAAKVLRVPGTANYKDRAFPKSVKILHENRARFTFSDLDELLPPLEKQIKESQTAARTETRAHSIVLKLFLLGRQPIPHTSLPKVSLPLERLLIRHSRCDPAYLLAEIWTNT